MKFATIGTSWITQCYSKAAKYTGLWELEAVYSRNNDTALAFAEAQGANRYYTNLQALAENKDIEAVYIASPNSLHYAQSKQMLSAGKHVICEKPATVTADEYRELRTLAKNKGLIYTEAIMSMHVPAFQLLQSEIKKIGTIATAHIDYCQLSSKYPALARGELPNIFNPAHCTGALMDLGVYNLYFIVSLFGKPNSIVSSSAFLYTGADYMTGGIFVYDDKQIAFTCAKTGQGFSQSEIIGDKGTIGIDSISQLTGITRRVAKSEQTEELVPFEVDRTWIMSHEALNFHRFITDPTSLEFYEHLHDIAQNVRDVCDTIRQQNKFQF